jgi:hypothetical protein
MKSYRELDQMYIAKEYQQLVNILPSQSILCKDIKYFLKNKGVYKIRYQKSFIYHNLSQYLYTYFTSVYRIMYIVPYSYLALCVNIKGVHCSEILKWRLTINK